MLASSVRSLVGLFLALPLRLSSSKVGCVLPSGIGLPIWTDLLAWVLWVLTMGLSSLKVTEVSVEEVLWRSLVWDLGSLGS